MVTTLHDERKKLEQQAARAYQAKDYAAAAKYVRGAISKLVEMSAGSQGRLAEAYGNQLQQLRNFEHDIILKTSGGKAPAVAAATVKSVIPASRPAAVNSQKSTMDDSSKLTFEDLVGMDAFKETVNRLVISPLRQPELARRCGVKAGGGVLLYGPPGTGKTYAAQCIAGELGLPFYPVKTSDIISQYVGESEKQLAELFGEARAQKEGAIVFFDEIDGLTPSRGNNGLAQHDERFITALKTEMAGLDSKTNTTPLLVMASTNCPWSVDSSFLRPGRFDVILYIDLPDFAARLQYLRYVCGKNHALADDVVLTYIARATKGYSYADLQDLCSKVAYHQFKHYSERNNLQHFVVTYPREAFERALAETRPSVQVDDEHKLKDWGALWHKTR